MTKSFQDRFGGVFAFSTRGPIHGKGKAGMEQNQTRTGCRGSTDFG